MPPETLQYAILTLSPQITFAVLACLQLALLVVWSLSSTPRTQVSVAAAVLSLVSAVVACALSYAEHTRSIRPSTALSAYFSLSVLLDIAQTRTLWLSPDLQVIAGLFTASLLVKVAVLLLEATGKRRLLFATYRDEAPESLSGIFNRSVFWWLNNSFRRGFKGVLVTEDLVNIERTFSSKLLFDKIKARWANGGYKLSIHANCLLMTRL